MTGRGTDGTAAVDAWVWTENLHPWLQVLGRICGFGLDDLDWAMIDLELEATDAECDRWFEYRVAGDRAIDVSLAFQAGTGMTSVKVWCPDELVVQVELVTHIAYEYRMR